LSGKDIADAASGIVSLVWIGLAFYVIWLLRPLLPGLVDRVRGFEGWGMKFALSGGEQAMAAAVAIAAKNPQWPAEATEKERHQALEKAKARRLVYEGAEILWVDYRPSNNRNESRMLRSFGALITFAATTDEAMEALKVASSQVRPFHVILSDISRDLPPPPDTSAGLKMLATFRAQGINAPLIFYVGQPKPGAATPDGAFGITHRPDILLTLVGDALAQGRIG